MREWLIGTTGLTPGAQGCGEVTRDGTALCQPSKANTQGAQLLARLCWQSWEPMVSSMGTANSC